MTLPWDMAGAAMLAGQARTAGAQHHASWSDRIQTSPAAWILAGALCLVALYFLIRLLEWDAMNKDAEDQEDPLLK